MLPTDFTQAFGEVMRAWQQKRPLVQSEELAPFVARFIAWDPTVSCIIASSERDEDMPELIRAAGYDQELCVVEFISDRSGVD